MARQQDRGMPARAARAGLALLIVLSSGIAAAAEDAGMPSPRLELGLLMQPAGGNPVLLITVPEPEPPTTR
jgi:hypothetical protein